MFSWSLDLVETGNLMQVLPGCEFTEQPTKSQFMVNTKLLSRSYS